MAATLLQTDSVLRPQAQEGTTGIHLPRSETGFGQRLLLHKLRHSKNGNWSGKKTTRQFQYGHLLSRPSDTPDDAFPGPTSLPKVEVVLHCGDFTMIGGLSNYKKAIENIKALNAELKLVIAGTCLSRTLHMHDSGHELTRISRRPRCLSRLGMVAGQPGRRWRPRRAFKCPESVQIGASQRALPVKRGPPQVYTERQPDIHSLCIAVDARVQRVRI